MNELGLSDANHTLLLQYIIQNYVRITTLVKALEAEWRNECEEIVNSVRVIH